MKIFLKYLKLKNKGNTVDCEKITLKEIESRTSYLKTISTPKNSIYYTIKPTLSNSTIQSKRTSIKNFIKFLNLIYGNGIDYRKIELKKCKSDYVESITQTEFELFMNFIGNYEKYRINALRSQLLVNIGYTSGMRLSEMLALRIDDILKGETRITGKGKKVRWVFFTPSTEKLLEDYI
jgi:site-specific recombinase XerD